MALGKNEAVIGADFQRRPDLYPTDRPTGQIYAAMTSAPYWRDILRDFWIDPFHNIFTYARKQFEWKYVFYDQGTMFNCEWFVYETNFTSCQRPRVATKMPSGGGALASSEIGPINKKILSLLNMKPVSLIFCFTKCRLCACVNTLWKGSLDKSRRISCQYGAHHIAAQTCPVPVSCQTEGAIDSQRHQRPRSSLRQRADQLIPGGGVWLSFP